jgi:hypothetical protein
MTTPAAIRTVRLATATIITITAICLTVAATAAAAGGENPLFTPATGQAIVGTSGTSILYFAGRLVVCGKDTYTGTVSSTLLLGNAKLHYLECVSLATPTSATHCPINSSGASAGLILWNTLHGVLGLILPNKHTGILFLPQDGATFTKLEKNECTFETSMTGNIVGEYTPIGVSQKTSKITFTLTPGAANPASVKDFDLAHGRGLVKPELDLFSEAAGLSQTQELQTEANLEVT